MQLKLILFPEVSLVYKQPLLKETDFTEKQAEVESLIFY